MDQDIVDIINSETNIVFIFGHTGAGKTCFLATLYEYLRNNYKLDLNYSNNISGIKYIQSIHKQMKNDKTLPVGNEVLKWYEIDIGFKKNGKRVSFRFLDFAGEDLKSVDPNTTHPISGQSDGTLDEHVIKYLQHPQIPIIILNFADYDFAEQRDDELIANFFRYNKDFFYLNASKIGLIVSKWDKHKEYISLLKFLEVKLPQTFAWLKDEDIKVKNAFPFSVGEIDNSNSLKTWKTYDCVDIVDWLTQVYEKNSKFVNGNIVNVPDKPYNPFTNWISSVSDLWYSITKFIKDF